MEIHTENTRKIEKPWGYELIYAHTEKYVGKILFVKQGHRLSLQYHKDKDETIYVLEGQIELQVGTTERELAAATLFTGESIRLKPFTLHRIKALVHTTLLEASTSELTDVVRLEDDYGRA